MNTHVDKIQENKSKSVANEVSQRKLVQNNFQFVDNRPEAIAQRKLQEIANKTVPLYQTIQKKSNNLDSNSFNVTQLNTWNEWEEPLTKVDAGTASLATFGMAVIKMLSEAYKLRIGGSLAAKMYGAPRQPVDIDFEVSGEAKKATEAKEHFMKLAQRPKFTWIHGRNVFFITDYAPQGGVVAIDFKCVKADKEPNPYDDEDEDLIAIKKLDLKGIPVVKTKIDFSSEEIFKINLTPTSTDEDSRGHYGADYLVASYLNRLASNLGEKVPDPKDDRGQVKAILTQLIRSRKINNLSEIAGFIESWKKTIMLYVKESMDRTPKIIEIYESIGKEVLEGFIPRGKTKVYLKIPAEKSKASRFALFVINDTYRAIKQLAEDRGLEDQSHELVEAFKSGEPYSSREQIETTLLAVVPKKKSVVDSITDYIVEEYGE